MWRLRKSCLFSGKADLLYEKVDLTQLWHDYNKETPRCVEICSVNIDGSNLRQLTHNQGRKTPIVATHNHVLFCLIEEGYHYDAELLMMKADGTALERIVTGKSNGTYEETAIFPDYRSIIFVDDIDSPYWYDLYMKDLFGDGRAKRLTKNGGCNGANPAISPDGRFIAFMEMPNGKRTGVERDVRIIDTNTGIIKTICKNY